MVQGIKDIKWYRKNDPLDKNHEKVLKKIPYSLPNTFVELLKISDGGQPNNYNCFEYIYRVRSNNSMNGNFIVNYLYQAEFFPMNLVPFSRDGGANLTCFDYRADPKTDNPPIVFWWRNEAEEESIECIAKDFDEFIANLEEYDDEEE